MMIGQARIQTNAINSKPENLHPFMKYEGISNGSKPTRIRNAANHAMQYIRINVANDFAHSNIRLCCLTTKIRDRRAG
jgi:hypothetical protein